MPNLQRLAITIALGLTTLLVSLPAAYAGDETSPARGVANGNMTFYSGGTAGNTTFTLGSTSTSSDATVVRFGGGSYSSGNQQFGNRAASSFLAGTTAYNAVVNPYSDDRWYSGTFSGTSYLESAAPIQNQVGYYMYTTTFNAQSSTFTINGGVRGDNGMYDVIYDYGLADQSVLSLAADSSGSQYGVRTTSNISSYTDFLSGSRFNGAGQHTLSFVLYNADGLTGVDFTANVVSAVPEPGIFVTCGSLLAMTGLGLFRGRRIVPT